MICLLVKFSPFGKEKKLFLKRNISRKVYNDPKNVVIKEKRYLKPQKQIQSPNIRFVGNNNFCTGKYEFEQITNLDLGNTPIMNAVEPL